MSRQEPVAQMKFFLKQLLYSPLPVTYVLPDEIYLRVWLNELNIHLLPVLLQEVSRYLRRYRHRILIAQFHFAKNCCVGSVNQIKIWTFS